MPTVLVTGGDPAGHARLVAVLPHLRASKGRLVFVSSVSGRISTPIAGVYSASKFALEAMADALRMELAPWGIRVLLIAPAQTDTDLWRRADEQLDETVAGAVARAPQPVRQAYRGIP